MRANLLAGNLARFVEKRGDAARCEDGACATAGIESSASHVFENHHRRPITMLGAKRNGRPVDRQRGRAARTHDVFTFSGGTVVVRGELRASADGDRRPGWIDADGATNP